MQNFAQCREYSLSLKDLEKTWFLELLSVSLLTMGLFLLFSELFCTYYGLHHHHHHHHLYIHQRTYLFFIPSSHHLTPQHTGRPPLQGKLSFFSFHFTAVSCFFCSVRCFVYWCIHLPALLFGSKSRLQKQLFLLPYLKLNRKFITPKILITSHDWSSWAAAAAHTDLAYCAGGGGEK